jgi:hypothetical protein
MRSGDDGREDVDGGFSDPEKEMTNWLLALQHCGKRVGEELLKLQDEEGVVSVVLTHTDSKHGQLPLLSCNRIIVNTIVRKIGDGELPIPEPVREQEGKMARRVNRRGYGQMSLAAAAADTNDRFCGMDASELSASFEVYRALSRTQ